MYLWHLDVVFGSTGITQAQALPVSQGDNIKILSIAFIDPTKMWEAIRKAEFLPITSLSSPAPISSSLVGMSESLLSGEWRRAICLANKWLLYLFKPPSGEPNQCSFQSSKLSLLLCLGIKTPSILYQSPAQRCARPPHCLASQLLILHSELSTLCFWFWLVSALTPTEAVALTA